MILPYIKEFAMTSALALHQVHTGLGLELQLLHPAASMRQLNAHVQVLSCIDYE